MAMKFEFDSFLLGIAASILVALFWSFSLQIIAYFLKLPNTKNVEFVSVYGLEHSILNWVNDSSWLNLGYWKDAETFPDACKALTNLVISSLNLSESSTILDLGIGCGDQDLYILQNHNVSRIYGVTLETVQSDLALEKYRRFESGKDRFFVIRGDAVDPLTWVSLNSKQRCVLSSTQSDMDRSSASMTLIPLVDVVLSIDSCYHFETRRKFFSLTYSQLRAGGKVAISDIIIHAELSLSQRMLVKVFSLLTRTPTTNLIPESTYKAQLEETGFKDIQIEEISDMVFPKVYEYFKDLDSKIQSKRMSMFLWAGWLLDYLWRAKILRFIVVSAKK